MEASLLDTVRITGTFTNERLEDVLIDLTSDTGIKLFTEPGPRISQIRFEDEPLRICLDRLRHLVSGSYEFADNALHFKLGGAEDVAPRPEARQSEQAPSSAPSPSASEAPAPPSSGTAEAAAARAPSPAPDAHDASQS